MVKALDASELQRRLVRQNDDIQSISLVDELGIVALEQRPGDGLKRAVRPVLIRLELGSEQPPRAKDQRMEGVQLVGRRVVCQAPDGLNDAKPAVNLVEDAQSISNRPLGQQLVQARNVVRRERRELLKQRCAAL